MTPNLARVTSFLGLLLLVPNAAGAPTGEEWSDDDRSVSAWPDGGGFVVRSTRDSAVANDEIAADYDAPAARLSVMLNAIDPRETTLALVLAVQSVTEFHDTDGDGRLGMGEPVVRRVEVPGTPATSTVQALPGGGWLATATHTLPPPAPDLASPTATARLEVVLTARPQLDGSQEPTQLDLDLRVVDGWARNGTHLAIEAALDTASAPADVSADVARVRDGGHALAAAWQDGRGDVVEGTDARSMTFVRAQPAGHIVSFPAALSASWSPDRAGGFDGAPGGNALLYIGAAVLAAAAFIVPAWRRLRAS